LGQVDDRANVLLNLSNIGLVMARLGTRTSERDCNDERGLTQNAGCLDGFESPSPIRGRDDAAVDGRHRLAGDVL
jgi:hypothetical protein